MFKVFFGIIMLFQQQPSFVDVSSEYLVRNYTVEDGLPVNAISDIVQDEDGYLYFATYNGLVRYDGYEFVTFNSSNSEGLESDRIVGMTIDRFNVIWLIDETRKVISYKEGTFKTYGTSDGVTGNAEYIEISDDGDVWVLMSNGLLKFNPNQNSFEQQNELNHTEAIWRIAPLGNGKVLGVSENGLFEWDGQKTKYLLSRDEFPIRKSAINFIKKLSDGNIWMASSGVFSFNVNTMEITTYEIPDKAFSQTWSIIEADSEFIISTTNGFYSLNKGEKKARQLPVEVNPLLNRPKAIQKYNENRILFGNQVIINDRVIFETEDVKTGFIDREGSIWVTSESKGLFQLRKSIVTNITASDNSVIKNIYSIIQDSEGGIWAGSFENGIIRIGDKEKTIYTVENSNLGSNIVRFMYEDEKGVIYAGLWGRGLWKFSNNDWEQLSFPDYLTVEAMHHSSNDITYIGTKDGSYIKQSGSFFDFEDVIGKPFDGVRVIREASDETLFFGTNGNGLGILDSEKLFRIVTKNEGLISDLIRDIYVQSSDTLWLATENRGLNRITLNDSNQIIESVHITGEDGLISSSLHRIIDDGTGNFWISSNQGVMQISKTSLNSYADGNIEYLGVVKYNQRDGMVNQEANGGVQTAGILAKDGNIWFPNQKGVTVFNPKGSEFSQFQSNTMPIIEYINLADTTIGIAGETNFMLAKGERNFSVKFTAPNFAFPERTVFKYRLRSLQEHWIVSNQAREAVFTNLPPGTYKFDIQADVANASISTSTLLITIPAFFYETIYFKLLMVLCAISFGFIVYRYRVQSLKEREKDLQRRVKDQTQKLEQAAEEKSRFFTGITHELKTPLALILGPLDEFLEQRDLKSEKQLHHYLQMMHRNGYRLKNLVDQILDVSKLNADAIKLNIHPFDIEKLTRQIAGQFQSLLDQEGITLDINSDTISEPVYVDKEAWERIVINLLSNAIKFSSQGGHITVTLEDQLDSVQISVKDSGKGISAPDHEKVFEYLYQSEGEKAAEGTGVGLYLVKGLIERMGGSVQLRSEEQQGAEFILTLQKGAEHFMKEDHLSHKPMKVDEINGFTHRSPTSKLGNDDNKSTADKASPKILIVEDNPDFRDYIMSVLEDEYHVVTAKNGKEGLSIIQKVQPDIVISDVMMPVMNGFEFISQLRELHEFKQIPVIFLSAKDQDVDVQQGLSTGADIYLTKPIRSSTLISQIEAVLRREKVLKEKTRFLQTGNQDEPELVIQLREIVYRQLGNQSLNVNLIADKLYMSRAKLYRSWKPVSDISVTEFIKKIRFEEAIVLIKDKEFSIQDAAQAVGYSDPNYFSTSFKKEFGYSPSDLLK